MEAFPTILLITDDPVLAQSIPPQLQYALGATTHVASHLDAAQEHFAPNPPALAIVDTALPDATPTALKELRAHHPLMGLILVGTAHTAHAPLSLPLTAHAARPLVMRALIRALQHLAYMRKVSAGGQALALPGGVEFVVAENRLDSPSGAGVTLTEKEGAVLLCLYHHRNAPIPRQMLLEEVWGYGEGINTHTLETHLYRLRQKLKAFKGGEDWIISSQGAYHLTAS